MDPVIVARRPGGWEDASLRPRTISGQTSLLPGKCRSPVGSGSTAAFTGGTVADGVVVPAAGGVDADGVRVDGPCVAGPVADGVVVPADDGVRVDGPWVAAVVADVDGRP